MSKEKATKLQKYCDSIKSRLEAPLPEKHKSNPETYRAFLKNEFEAASKKVADLKLTEKK